MGKQITIKDIARKLNLHHATVSRALRDDQRVLPKTKDLILTLAEELNYHPNFIAQSLTKRSSKMIGVIIPEIMHEFFGSVISGVEEVLYEKGYNLLVCQSSEKYEREVVNLHALISRQVDGLLVSISQETKDADHFKFAQRQGIPIVFFNRTCGNIKAPKVLVDDYGGANAIMEHLIRKGYKRIAHFAGPQAISTCINRFNAYIDALKKYHLPIDEGLIIPCGFSEEDGVLCVHRLIDLNKDLPDAVFAVNDPMAIGAMTCFKENGLKIPDDIALAGFSDDRVSSFISPSLTTVRQPTTEMGKIAIKRLLNEIEHKGQWDAEETVILKAEIVIRNST